MTDILKTIETYKRREIAEAKVRMPLHALERQIGAQHPPPRRWTGSGKPSVECRG